jgi:hypothetical protein
VIHFYSANTKDLKWYKKIINLSWWIKVFTHYQYPAIPFEGTFTHVSIGEDVTRSGRRLIFESYVVQMLNPYDNPKITIHFVNNHIQINDAEIFWNIVDKKRGKPYAFLQLLDFIRLWFYNKVFKKDPKNVWFPASDVCSEIGYASAIGHATKYNLSFLQSRLLTSNSNFYSPMRLYGVLLEAANHGETILEYN